MEKFEFLKILNSPFKIPRVKFYIGKVKNNQVDGFIDFEDADFKTYVINQPLVAFNYTQINDSLWVYKTNINKYSGEFNWVGNKIIK